MAVLKKQEKLLTGNVQTYSWKEQKNTWTVQIKTCRVMQIITYLESASETLNITN